MSTSNFSPRDRADHIQIPSHMDGGKWVYKDRDPDHGRIRYMARSGGYVMVRKTRSMPFVMTEKEWAKLPLYEESQP